MGLISFWAIFPMSDSASADVTPGLHIQAYTFSGDYENPEPSNMTPCDMAQTVVSQINAEWGDGGPGGDCPSDFFAIHYWGFITSTEGGNIQLSSVSDDGFRLSIGGQMVIDDWNLHGCGGPSGSFYFEPGVSYPIDAWFYEYGGGACSMLYWETPNTGFNVVPDSAFTQTPTVLQILNAPVNPVVDSVIHDEVHVSWTASEGSTVTTERYAVFFSYDNWQSGYAIASTTLSAIIYQVPDSATISIKIRADNDSLHFYSAFSNAVTAQTFIPVPEPLVSPSPVPSETVTEPIPSPSPTPQPTSEPSPSPIPTQEPVVEPTPTPQPTQEPAPNTPEPTPSNPPSPAIDPTPDSVRPEPPVVVPEPEPNPVEPEPLPEEPAPTPEPDPQPEPPVPPAEESVPPAEESTPPIAVEEPPALPEEQTPIDAPDIAPLPPEPLPLPEEESNSNLPLEPLVPGLIPNNPDSLPDDIPKLPEEQALKPHIQEDKPGVENGGIEFYGTKTQPQVIGEDGKLTPPPPAPGSGDPIPPDAITTEETFIGQPGGTTFNAPDIAVPVLPIEINIEIPGVGESVQAIADAYVAMANIGNDMSPITRKKAKKILIATLVAGQITQLRRRF
jgi:hypothetical protein